MGWKGERVRREREGGQMSDFLLLVMYMSDTILAGLIRVTCIAVSWLSSYSLAQRTIQGGCTIFFSFSFCNFTPSTTMTGNIRTVNVKEVQIRIATLSSSRGPLDDPRLLF